MSGSGQQIATPVMMKIDLLAQGRVDSLGDRFRNGAQMEWTTMFVVIVVLAMAIGVVWLVSRHLSLKDSGGYHNHRGLFRELCWAHRLGWWDRRLLVSIARQQGVVVPARLFVEPEWFAPERQEGLKEARRRHVARLCETLFAADADSISEKTSTG